MNDAIERSLDEHPEWRKELRDLKAKLRGEEHFDVLGDLVAFTGLDEDEVAFRVMRKNPRTSDARARGWFFEEWKWHDPASPREIDWFYKCAQSYLFSNARKTFWEPVGEYLDPKEHRVILDYGCGVGTNVLGLVKRGFTKIAYYDIGILQQEFVRFRALKHRLPRAFSVDNALNRLSHAMVHECCDGYCAIVLHDVLEHVPNYERLLARLIGLLRPGGAIVERSAFGNHKNKPFHLPERVPIKDAMHGMKQIAGDNHTARLWRKS